MTLPGSAQQQHGPSAGAALSHSSSVKSAPRGRTRRRSYSDSEGSDAAGSRMRSIPGIMERESSQDIPNFRDVLKKKFPNANAKPSSRDDDITALVDFLKNQPPPPSNFMAVPFDNDSSVGRGKWGKLKMIGKRSKPIPQPQPQPQIRLPDTAVSGTTTGGHRHIAISIPLEASPFGLVTRTQYPVFPHHDDGAASRSRSPSVRTFVNDKGVVSVLRAVDEDGDTSPGFGPASPASFRSQPAVYGARSRYDQRTKSPHIAFSKSQPDMSRAHNRHSRGLPSPSESYLTDADSMFPDTIEEEQDGSGSDVPSPKLYQRSAYPQRFSSAMYGRGHHIPGSIDGIISQKSSRPQSPLSTREKHERQPQLRRAVSDTPRPKSSKSSAANKQVSEHIADAPALAQNAVPDPLRMKKKSRRDIVKDRKKRDMEAMRNAKQSLLSKAPNDEHTTTITAEEKAPLSVPGSYPESIGKSNSNIRLTPVMVVMNQDPSCSEAQPSLPTQSINNEAVAPGTLACFGENGNLTPPQSNQGSPPQKYRNLDRTALARRREWNACRERERMAREAREAGPVSVGRLDTEDASFGPVQATKGDKDVTQLLDIHQEQRLYEMERRLQRLERNGDVWLRALFPMLKNIDYKLAADADGMGDRGWGSEEDLDGAVQRRSKVMDWDRSELEEHQRPMTMAHGELLRQLAGGRGIESWAEEDGYRDDWSGLASLEPIMRQLASDTQVRPGTA